MWAAQLQRYSGKYRCVALDMRGYNDSEKPAGVAQYDLDILADDVRAFVEALGYRTCTIVAHDWGGVVAWSVRSSGPRCLKPPPAHRVCEAAAASGRRVQARGCALPAAAGAAGDCERAAGAPVVAQRLQLPPAPQGWHPGPERCVAGPPNKDADGGPWR